MRKLFVVILVVLACTTTTQATEYQSSYGFTFDLPDHWLVLTRQEIRDNADLFDFEQEALGQINQELLDKVVAKVKSGNIELYFNMATADLSFTDNVNVIKQVGRIPTSASEVANACRMSAPQLSEYFGRDIELHQCESETINGTKFFVLEFDGALPGTRSMQYQFNITPSIAIFITATSKDSTAKRVKEEFSGMIHSLQVP